MDKDILKGIKFGFGFLMVFFILGSIFAVGFHSADEIIGGGTFFGNFIFNGSKNEFSSDVIIKPNPSADWASIYLNGRNSSKKMMGIHYGGNEWNYVAFSKRNESNNNWLGDVAVINMDAPNLSLVIENDGRITSSRETLGTDNNNTLTTKNYVDSVAGGGGGIPQTLSININNLSLSGGGGTVTVPNAETMCSGTDILDGNGNCITTSNFAQIDSGTWIPSLRDSSGLSPLYSFREGSYYRVGDLVYISGKIVLRDISTPVGEVRVSNFPFPISNNDGILEISRFVNGRDVDNVPILVLDSTLDIAYLKVWDFGGGGSTQDRFSNIEFRDLEWNSEIFFSGTYITN